MNGTPRAVPPPRDPAGLLGAGRDRAFVSRWVAANGVAEAVGLGATFLLAGLLGSRLQDASGWRAALGVATVAVLLGTLLEGVVVGIAQARVLRRRRPAIRRSAWIAATALGAALAWAVGMVPATLVALGSTPGDAAGTLPEPGLGLELALAAGLGLVTGPVLGLAQWAVLRRHAGRAGRWLLANAAAWAVGMPVVFLGMHLVPWDAPAALRAAVVGSVCLAAGLVVGAVHGPVLAELLPRKPDPRP